MIESNGSKSEAEKTFKTGWDNALYSVLSQEYRVYVVINGGC
ncbi:hypothetical protein NB716_003821 [Pantoea ananatis]|nr:hypothetical protein [Pantoea ananatis]